LVHLVDRGGTDRGPCLTNWHGWGRTISAVCECMLQQSMNRVVDMSPLTKFEGRLQLLHAVDHVAPNWQKTAATVVALMKQNE